MVMDGALYFTTLRASLKARRIKATGRVRVGLGAPDGPSFEGRAEWGDDRPDLEQAGVGAYRPEYPPVVPLLMGRWVRKRPPGQNSGLVRVSPGLALAA